MGGFLEYILREPRPSKPPRRAIIAQESQWGFAKRSFGWELKELEENEPYDVNIDWTTLHFGLRLSHPDPWTGITSEFVVAVYEGEDPVDVAQRLSEYIGAEPVKARWLAAVLQNGARREGDIVDATVYTLDDVALNITVREGDDLHQVATWHAVRNGLNDGHIEVLSKSAEGAHIFAYDVGLAFSKTKAGPSYLMVIRRRASLENYKAAWTEPSECSITVGLTTCKRLRHFRLTMQGLIRVFKGDIVDHPLVCRVVVVKTTARPKATAWTYDDAGVSSLSTCAEEQHRT